MYQVLARKYRPRNFIELVGQTHVSRALTSALERGRLHHAYLFTGTRGVGKTTIARILAKCLNCETGVTSTPCEVCATCKAVNEGRFIDLIEIDAASRTKVEDTRELLDNVPYAPTQGRFKVYLIDEVHMLSTHSFNALLKTLEEPPEHVKFLFATTDPQKLPITVISRCLQFTLRPLVVDEITAHLTEILQKEQVAADADAIWQIAESAQGSLRDALSLTDQAIAYGQGAIQHQDVKEMLGLIDRHIIYDLLLAIHQNNSAQVSQLLTQFRQQALDVALVLDQLISTLHELAMLQYLPEMALKYSDEINRKIHQLSQFLQPQDIQLYYQIACKGRADLQLAVTPTQGFEMCVLRLLAFRPLQMDEVVAVQQPQTPVIADNHPPQYVEAVVDVIQPVTQTPEHAVSDDYEFDFPVDESRPTEQVVEQVAVQTVPMQQDPKDQELELNAVQSDTSTAAVSDAEFALTEDESELEAPVLPNNAEEIAAVEAMHRAVAEAYMAELQTQQLAQTDDEQAPVSAAVEDDLWGQAVEAPQVEHNSVPVVEPVLFAAEMANTVQEEPSLQHATKHELASQDVMPLDLLNLAEQNLTGEWTLEKWEYWFRHSQMSPAVQGIAQQGVMQGQIDGTCQLIIPAEYQSMLEQLQYSLEEALKTTWPNTQFTVQYQPVEQITPFMAQSERKRKAYARADELLRTEPVIQGLLTTFDAELHNIELKLDADKPPVVKD